MATTCKEDVDFIETPDNFRSPKGSAQKQDYSKGQGKSGSVPPKREGDKSGYPRYR